MRFSIQKLPKSQIEISFEIPNEEFQNYFREAVLNLGRDLEIEGFRKGKAPKEIIEKEIGFGKILEEAANLAVRESYVKAILENKIEAIGRPEIQITKLAKGSPLEFKTKVAVISEINLPDYKAIASKIKPKEVFIENKEVEEALIFLQKSRANFLPKTKACEKGDFIEITFKSPQLENNQEQKDAFLLGQGRFIPGFEEQLLGMKKDEEKKFSLVFPKDHFQKELAEKSVDFQVKIISVSKIELPEITDSWAKSLGNFENLDSLKNSIKAGIKTEKEEAEKQKKRAEILEKIQEKTSLEIADILINFEKEKMIAELKDNLQNQFQMGLEDYLTKIKKTEEDLKQSFSVEAEKRVKSSLILREIAKKENISTSKEEISGKINEFLKNYPDIEKTKKELDLEKLKDYYESVIKNEKVFQLLENL